VNFNTDLYWNDSVLTKIEIDRSNPGNQDTIVFEIDWYDLGPGKLVFNEVYLAKMNLNFGIVASECILNAFEADENDPDIIDLYAKWKGMLDKVELHGYVINLNSSGSEIKILAKSFEVTFDNMLL